jgi:hypothetical protein
MDVWRKEGEEKAEEDDEDGGKADGAAAAAEEAAGKWARIGCGGSETAGV